MGKSNLEFNPILYTGLEQIHQAWQFPVKPGKTVHSSVTAPFLFLSYGFVIVLVIFILSNFYLKLSIKQSKKKALQMESFLLINQSVTS